MDELLDEIAVAKLLGIKPQTLAIWRMKKEKLPFSRVGRLIRYRKTDVEHFLTENTVSVEAKK